MNGAKTASQNSEFDLEALRDRVREFIVTQSFDMVSLARKTGVPVSRIKSFLQGGEDAQERRDARKLWRLLESDDTGSRLPFMELEFVETTAAREVMNALDLARESALMVLVLGPSGVGKSCAVSHYMSIRRNGPIPETEDIVYVQANSAMSPKDCLETVAGACGVTVWRRNMRDMQADIAQWLGKPGRLLVIDEGDFVSEKTFQSLRQCWDSGQAGLAFLGTRGWLKTLRRYGRASDTVEQFLSRFGYVVRLSKLDDEDMADVLEQYELSKSARDAAIRGANGNARRAISACRLASEIGDGKMSAARIKAAFSRLAPVV